MNLSIKELNELVYCVGRVIAEDKNGYNSELRQQVFDKIYSELEGRMDQIQQTVDEYTHIREYEPDKIND